MLEVVNTIEVRYTATTPKGAAGDIQVDESFAKERIEAYKTMYADLECIGWYSVRGGPSCTGSKDQDAPTAQDLAIHRTVISKLCENALMLIMNPLSQEAHDKKRLPLFIFEARQTQEDQAGKVQFMPIEFTLASSDSEQISVNDVAHSHDKDAKVSSMSQHMASALNAVKILRTKVNFLMAAVRECPEIRKNHGFMRRLNQIVASTPIVAQAEFDA
jgi:hypothetical protein